uniref:Immediate early response 3-interacting protein 1 n=1 Tax=Sinocyclocheilus anshuiensis TaxID=1608454 RepID=A0A671K2G2_9TELE
MYILGICKRYKPSALDDKDTHLNMHAYSHYSMTCIIIECSVINKLIIFTVGWGAEQGIGGFGDEPGIKAQLLNLIRSVRTVMRVPLIAVNSVCIVLLLLFG